MIFKRLSANLRAQNWFAIGIEFAIVVAGVFVGTWVANWNEERIERAETTNVLSGLLPQLKGMDALFASFNDYYAVTRRYAETAFAGWRGDPAVSDKQFVIAAYQASQITNMGFDMQSWSRMFGEDRVRQIRDKGLRDDLALLMSAEFGDVENQLLTGYRRSVRRVIPSGIQDAIRAKCGDKAAGYFQYWTLPPTCDVDLPGADWAAAARTLRAHPELAEDLNYHNASVAGVLNANPIYRTTIERIIRRIESGAR